MPLRLSAADAKRIFKGKIAGHILNEGPETAFSIDTWREIPRPPGRIKLKPEELAQFQTMNMLRMELPGGWVAFHIPSEAVRSPVTWAFLRVLGFFAGFPDIMILAPGGRCYFVEMKRPDQKPKLSPAQISFQRWAEKFDVPYLVAQDAESVQGWVAALTARESV